MTLSAQTQNNDTPPRILSCLATRGSGRCEALQSHFLLPTNGSSHIMPGLITGSLLCLSFNTCWATALNYYNQGIIDYFLLRHDDIEVRTHKWTDVMVAEMKRTGAAMLSAVVALKTHGEETSTAVCSGDVYDSRRLTLSECDLLPKTFCTKDLARIFPDGHGPLLANTGLMLIDMSRPELQKLTPDGELFFHFRNHDRVVPRGNEFKAETAPEDWNFSRMCHAKGLPVYCTTLIETNHWGEKSYSNRRQTA